MTLTAPLSSAPKRLWWWIAAAAVIALLATFTWALPSVNARGDVRVLPRSMHCGTHEVPYRLIAEDGEVPYSAFDVTLRPTSFCQIEITVVNSGSRSVHVDSATFPGMGHGSDANAPLEITLNGGRFNAEDSGTNAEGDAVLSVDETLAEGSSMDLLFDLRTRKSAFIGDPHRTTGMAGMPRLQVSSGGLHGTVIGTVELITRERT